MTYDEAIESTVTKAQALREIKLHGCEAISFFEDLGEHDTYAGADVLGWLGY